jgi:hypothetical protein
MLRRASKQTVGNWNHRRVDYGNRLRSKTQQISPVFHASRLQNMKLFHADEATGVLTTGIWLQIGALFNLITSVLAVFLAKF